MMGFYRFPFHITNKDIIIYMSFEISKEDDRVPLEANGGDFVGFYTRRHISPCVLLDIGQLHVISLVLCSLCTVLF